MNGIEVARQCEVNLRGAIKLLGIYTGGKFDVWLLAGSAKASCRAHVMSVLHGTKIPQSKSGITAIREALYTQAKINGDYPAAREEAFLQFCKEVQS